MLTTKEAASRSHGILNARHVARLARRGKLTGAIKQPDRTWLIPEEALDSYIKRLRSAESNILKRMLYWCERASRWPLVVLLIAIATLVTNGLDFYVNVHSFLDIIAPGSTLYVDKAQTGEILVLVAEFKGSGSYDPTTRIHRTLYEAVEAANLQNVRIERVPDSPEVSKDALLLGDRYEATVVIWGTFDEAAIEPRFEIVKNPGFCSPLPELEQAINTDVRSFNLYMARDLPLTYEYFTLVTLGQLYLFEDELTSAVDVFSQALEINLGDREAAMATHHVYELRGFAYGSLGSYSDALADYKQSLEINPEQVDAYTSMAIVQIMMGDYQAAMRLIDDALEIDDQFWNAYRVKGLIHYLLGDYEDALAELNVALALLPGDYDISKDMENALKLDIYGNRALVYDALGEVDKARLDYERALEIDPNSVHIYHNLGHLELASSGNPEIALKYFDKALSLEYQDPKTYQGRGVAYRWLGNYDAAMEDFQRVIDSAPEYGGGYYERGVAYLALKDFDSALKDFDKTIEIWPDNIIAYKKRGVTLMAMQRLDEALADFTKLIDIAPSDDYGYIGRGHVYLLMDDPVSALADFEQSVKLNPSNEEAILGRGAAKMKMGHYEDAIQDFTNVLQINPDHAAAYRIRSVAFLHLRNYEAALSDCQRFLSIVGASQEVSDVVQCALYSPDSGTMYTPETIDQLEPVQSGP